MSVDPKANVLDCGGNTASAKPKLSREFQFMFTHLGDPKKTLDAIKRELDTGWVLYSLNDDKAFFYIEVEQA
jgi:hypothetical protein